MSNNNVNETKAKEINYMRTFQLYTFIIEFISLKIKQLYEIVKLG